MNQELEGFKWKIKGAFHSWVITDPYPELTEWQLRQEWKGSIGRFFGRIGARPDPKPQVSVHKAWMDGYAFAKKLVESKLE